MEEKIKQERENSRYSIGPPWGVSVESDYI